MFQYLPTLINVSLKRYREQIRSYAGNSDCPLNWLDQIYGVRGLLDHTGQADFAVLSRFPATVSRETAANNTTYLLHNLIY